MPSTGRWHSSPVRPGVPDAASLLSSARPEPMCTPPAGRPGISVRSTTGRRRSGRPPSSLKPKVELSSTTSGAVRGASSGTRLAVDTHLITSHAALPLLIRRPGGLVVEVTDGTLEYNAANYRLSAFYDLAKWSVLRLGWSQGHELAPYGCTALTITPGWLRSEMMLEIYEVTEATWRDVPGHFGISESPRFVGRAVTALAADPDVARWNQASVSSGQLARECGFTDLDGSAPDAWRYMVEVQDAGKDPAPENYR